MLNTNVTLSMRSLRRRNGEKIRRSRGKRAEEKRNSESRGCMMVSVFVCRRFETSQGALFRVIAAASRDG